MQIKDLIKQLNKYPKEYEVTVNCPDTNSSRNIWLVDEDNGISENGKKPITFNVTFIIITTVTFIIGQSFKE